MADKTLVEWKAFSLASDKFPSPATPTIGIKISEIENDQSAGWSESAQERGERKHDREKEEKNKKGAKE